MEINLKPWTGQRSQLIITGGVPASKARQFLGTFLRNSLTLLFLIRFPYRFYNFQPSLESLVPDFPEIYAGFTACFRALDARIPWMALTTDFKHGEPSSRASVQA